MVKAAAFDFDVLKALESSDGELRRRHRFQRFGPSGLTRTPPAIRRCAATSFSLAVSERRSKRTPQAWRSVVSETKRITALAATAVVALAVAGCGASKWSYSARPDSIECVARVLFGSGYELTDSTPNIAVRGEMVTGFSVMRISAIILDESLEISVDQTPINRDNPHAFGTQAHTNRSAEILAASLADLQNGKRIGERAAETCGDLQST